MKIEYIDPRELIPYEKNTKIHDEKQIENLVGSIKRLVFRIFR